MVQHRNTWALRNSEWKPILYGKKVPGDLCQFDIDIKKTHANTHVRAHNIHTTDTRLNLWIVNGMFIK